MTTKISPKQLTLYFFPACPYCQRVLHALDDLGFSPNFAAETASDISLKDIKKNANFRNELIAGGGKATVPCIHITAKNGEQWMYESMDIVDFLKANLS